MGIECSSLAWVQGFRKGRLTREGRGAAIDMLLTWCFLQEDIGQYEICPTRLTQELRNRF